jgi:hypothetical protein
MYHVPGEAAKASNNGLLVHTRLGLESVDAQHVRWRQSFVGEEGSPERYQKRLRNAN